MAWPVKRNIKVTRGDTYEQLVEFFDDEDQTVESDMTGHTFAATARTDYGTDDAVDFDVDVSNIATGKILISLTEDQTRAMLSDDQGVWDFSDDNGSTVKTPFGGTVRMHPEVTGE